MTLIINEVIAGDQPSVYFKFNDMPTVPPSPKLDAITNVLMPIAIKMSPKYRNRYSSNVFYTPSSQASLSL